MVPGIRKGPVLAHKRGRTPMGAGAELMRAAYARTPVARVGVGGARRRRDKRVGAGGASAT